MQDPPVLGTESCGRNTHIIVSESFKRLSWVQYGSAPHSGTGWGIDGGFLLKKNRKSQSGHKAIFKTRFEDWRDKERWVGKKKKKEHLAYLNTPWPPEVSSSISILIFVIQYYFSTILRNFFRMLTYGHHFVPPFHSTINKGILSWPLVKFPVMATVLVNLNKRYP